MGCYAELRFGSLVIARVRDSVDDEVLSIFQDSMRILEDVKAKDYYGPDFVGSLFDDEDAIIRVLRYTGSSEALADRLDFIGITETEVLALLADSIEDSLAFRLANLDIDGPDLRIAEEISALKRLTPQRWLELVSDDEAILRTSRPYETDTPLWALGQVDCWEMRHFIRLFLLVHPNCDVTLDLTDLELDDGDMGGDAYLPSASLESLRSTLAAHSPMVVLTEGKTDAEFLQASLELLHPHLSDLIKFFDYEAKPEGGAGALARTVRAFAAASIANRVVALFDNDTAALDAMRNLTQATLPANIRVLHYPDIELAQDYPTLGPPTYDSPSATPARANVNGLACSIELYLGPDVLRLHAGDLSPVKWVSFVNGMGAYHGEVVHKKGIQEAFRTKVHRARSGTIDLDEWSDMEYLLHHVIHAFDDQPLPPQICSHMGITSVDVRPRRAPELTTIRRFRDRPGAGHGFVS